MDINQMQTILQSNLKPNRYAHCLGVMDTAIILAKRFGVDEEQAAIAGLLHDCAREFATEDLIAECEKRHLYITDIDRQLPILMHAPLGTAILADMIEPHRKFEGLDKLRNQAMTQDLDTVMISAFDQSILFIMRKGHTIHPYTVAARNEILLQREL